MKHLLSALAIALALAGCATTNLDGTPSVGDTTSLNYKESIAIRSVTAARQTSTALLVAGKITAAQDQATQASLDAIIGGIKTARANQAAADLDAAKVKADAITKANGGTPKP